MRLLIYGMQSSGASVFTYFLAQRLGCLALVDILNMYAAPRLRSRLDIVAKCVVTTSFPFELHAERFQPDKTLLLLRDPRDNYASLKTKSYRNHSGLMHEKFRLIDQIFAERARFDAVVHYEDFIDRAGAEDSVRALGWPVAAAYYDFSRTADQMIADLWRHEPELFDDFEPAFGNCDQRGFKPERRRKLRDPASESVLEELCPALLAHYREREGGAER